MTKKRPTKAQLAKVLSIINTLTGDDFCSDLDAIAAFHPDELSEKEKTAHEKLGRIYRLAHSFDAGCSCFDVHDDWRKEADSYPKEFCR